MIISYKGSNSSLDYAFTSCRGSGNCFEIGRQGGLRCSKNDFQTSAMRVSEYFLYRGLPVISKFNLSSPYENYFVLVLPNFYDMTITFCKEFAHDYSILLLEEPLDYSQLIGIVTSLFCFICAPLLLSQEWFVSLVLGSVSGSFTWATGILLIFSQIKSNMFTKERQQLTIASAFGFSLLMYETSKRFSFNTILLSALLLSLVLCIAVCSSAWFIYGPISDRTTTLIKFFFRLFGALTLVVIAKELFAIMFMFYFSYYFINIMCS